jgi:hypothetical protein
MALDEHIMEHGEEAAVGIHILYGKSKSVFGFLHWYVSTTITPSSLS